MTPWRLLETGPRPGRWNMACDAVLLDGGGVPPTVRFFAWDPPAVSLGHHQPTPAAAALVRLEELGLDWVRRPTGGRAVYHGGVGEELTYSVVAPIGPEGFPGGLADAHRRIHAAIAAGLSALGAEVDLAPGGRQAAKRGGRPDHRLACFAASVPGEITAGGRKLVGSAQRRSLGVLLQHGSIPLAGDQEPLATVWPGSLPAGRPTNLSAAAKRPVAFGETTRALAAAFEDTLGVRLVPGALSSGEEDRIEALVAESGSRDVLAGDLA